MLFNARGSPVLVGDRKRMLNIIMLMYPMLNIIMLMYRHDISSGLQ